MEWHDSRAPSRNEKAFEKSVKQVLLGSSSEHLALDFCIISPNIFLLKRTIWNVDIFIGKRLKSCCVLINRKIIPASQNVPS